MRNTLRTLLGTLTILLAATSALADGNVVGGGGLGKPTPTAASPVSTQP